MHPRVVFTVENSAPKELEKVRKFFHLLEYFALAWDANIQVDAPHGKPVKAESTEGILHIHFFSYAGEAASVRQLGFANQLYGFPVPTEELKIESKDVVKKNDVGARFHASEMIHLPGELKIIRSPEGRAVAEVSPGHIYILFDIAHREWDGDEFVLWRILSEAFPWLFGKEDYFLKLVGRELVSADYLHSEIATKAPRLKDKIAALCRLHLSEKLEGISKKERGVKGQHDDCSREYLKLSFQIDDVANRIANPADALTDEFLTREFNKILRMKTVKGVEVEEDGRIIVYTKPITMEDSQKQIGEYQIIITPYNEKYKNFAVVQIGEHGKRERYRHAGIQESQIPSVPCWGSLISPALTKAFADCDVPSTIHLALVFLIFDTRPPVSSYAKRHEDPDAGDQPERPFYQDEAAFNKALRGYIDIVRKFKENNLRESLETKWKEFAKEQAELVEKLIDLRKELKALEESRKFVTENMRRILPESELNVLLNDSSLIQLSVGQGWIWTIFAPQKGYGNFEWTVMPSLSLFFDVHSTWIYVTIGGKQEPVKRAKISYYEDAILLSGEDNETFTKLISFGRLGTAILAVRDLIYGKEEALVLNCEKDTKEDGDAKK